MFYDNEKQETTEIARVHSGSPHGHYESAPSFRGGPVCRADQVTPCEQCSERSAVTGLLRVQLNEFLRLQGVSHGGMYAIQGSWLCDWESYVKGYTPQPPGPIDNSSFVGQPGTGEDYFEVTGGQWELLVKLYGGGPPIQLKQPSAESDSRSLDERSNCDNLDSGCWLPNQNQAALENRPDSRVEDVTAGAAGVEPCAGGGAASPQQPAQAPQDAVALSVGTEDEEGGGDTAEDGLLEAGVASRQ
ncbi:hypothetical protein AAG570_007519 [Ranatra chinensis]|uniref:DUSP domain-containing protein n=1 Tax=Ranatra chinensis TaxID=642074 RepID=A0ABD0YEM1_9HEMI